jgi:diguanylate cyclase (GGDEF)-like protein
VAELWQLIGGAGYTTAVFALGRLSSSISWSTLFDSAAEKTSSQSSKPTAFGTPDGLLTEIKRELNTHSASTRLLTEKLDSADHDVISSQAAATRTDNSQFQKFLSDRCSELEKHPGSRAGAVKKLLGNLAGHRRRANELDGVLAKFEDPTQIESAISPLRDCIRSLEDHNKRLQSELEKTRQAVAQQSQKLELAQEEARVDALTGLPNRRAFDERIEALHEEFIQAGTTYSVALLDVDHFKKFNDEHGHAVGDKVLEVVGEVLRRTQRGTDHVARYGGEEFVVLLQKIPGHQARSVVDRHRGRVGKASLRVDGKDLSITVSAGVAEIQPGELVADVLERADAALYAAKSAGRNQTCLDDGTKVVDMDNQSLREEVALA